MLSAKLCCINYQRKRLTNLLNKVSVQAVNILKRVRVRSGFLHGARMRLTRSSLVKETVWMLR